MQQVLIQSGGVALLRNAMKLHTGSVKLQEDCIWALLNLTWGDDACRDAVRAEGVVPFIVEARIRHKGSTNLEAKSKELLSQIDPEGDLASRGARMPAVQQQT